jgi:hypothetical protein
MCINRKAILYLRTTDTLPEEYSDLKHTELVLVVQETHGYKQEGYAIFTSSLHLWRPSLVILKSYTILCLPYFHLHCNCLHCVHTWNRNHMCLLYRKGMCINGKATLYLLTMEVQPVTDITKHEHDQPLFLSACPCFEVLHWPVPVEVSWTLSLPRHCSDLKHNLFFLLYKRHVVINGKAILYIFTAEKMPVTHTT